ncbi:TPA: septum formation protein Maf [Candidatus Gastranaerophilales bacterium HUM_2]|nr:MAG TPA: septum formation protein Maf [Candidatus Gastranaerophilales bacterium HUM_2]
MQLMREPQDTTKLPSINKKFLFLFFSCIIAGKESENKMVGKIILASSSPRRADILKKHNIEFKIIPSPYVEDHSRTDFSYDFIENLAYNKAKAVVPLVNEQSLIVGADTIVVLDGKILGKPNGYDGAFEMLKNLSGKTHHVVTAIVVMDSDTQNYKKQSTTSEVTFENLTDEQIKYYIDNFKPFDKAGSYGIQEMPKGYIKSYTGDLENIIGISSKTLLEMIS